MADIFQQMDQLFSGREIDGTVNTFSLHRFLASDPAFAAAAKQLGVIRDEEMAVGVWRVSLPRLGRSPRFKWPAPKKLELTDELIKRFAEVENVSLVEANELLILLTAMVKKDTLLTHYGINASDR